MTFREFWGEKKPVIVPRKAKAAKADDKSLSDEDY